MATSPGRNLPDVIRLILDAAASYNFTQVAYLLEQSWPDRGKIGDGLDRWCRFRPATETSFPAADIRRCKYDDHGRLDIQLNFLGFYGVDAVVPHYFTDRAMLDDNGFTITALVALENNLAIASGLDWCTATSGIIDTLVCPDLIQDRVFSAQAETRADAGKFYW